MHERISGAGEAEFWKIVSTSFPESERLERIAQASEDSLIDKLFILGGQGYENSRRELEAAYFLSPEEAVEAISMGIGRISIQIRQKRANIGDV